MPPFDGVAANVTCCPEQLGLLPIVMAVYTTGTAELFTIMDILLLVDEAGLAQDELDVRTQLITSPLLNVLLV